MKKITLLLALTVPFFVFAASTEPQENKTSASSQHELIELFSVYCGACKMWDKKFIPELKEKLKAKNIGFKQAHTPFMGKYPGKISTALAITAETDRFDSLKSTLFDHIHKDRKGDWPSEKELFATFEKAGLSEKEYNQNKNNMLVLKQLSDWKNWSSSVNSIPTFLLDGKHPISAKGMKDIDDFVARIEEAIKQDRK